MNPKQFEEKYGSTILLKLGCSAVNRLLVKRNILKKKELQKAMDLEIKNYLKNGK